MRIGRQACRAQGNLAVKLLRDRRNAFWTCTSWDEESSMKAFMLTGSHGPSMRKLLEWCDEAALVHWTEESNQLPGWSEAHRRLLRWGRLSKVNHPSEAQKAFRIDEPDESVRAQVRLK